MNKPIPVVRDGSGKLISDYSMKDWFQKLNEELDEVKEAVIRDNNGHSNTYDKNDIAHELQDLITVATSMQEWLGFDEKARDKICAEVNQKNHKRGYHLTSETSLTIEEIDNIMVTALEGGINYWCGGVEVVGEYLGTYASDHLANGGSIVLYDLESPEKWTLTKDMVIDGFIKWLKSGCSQHVKPNKTVDWIAFDANDADCIIQYALFNKIIFG